MIGVAAEADVCEVTAQPSIFDHQRVTLKGIVTGLMKTTSRSGNKYMTFLLSSRAGCGGVVVYAQGPATLSNGDHFRSRGNIRNRTSQRGVHIPQPTGGNEDHCAAAVMEKPQPGRLGL